MIAEGRALRELHQQVTVKVPFCKRGPGGDARPDGRGDSGEHDPGLLGEPGAAGGGRRGDLRLVLHGPARRHLGRFRPGRRRDRRVLSRRWRHVADHRRLDSPPGARDHRGAARLRDRHRPGQGPPTDAGPSADHGGRGALPRRLGVAPRVRRVAARPGRRARHGRARTSSGWILRRAMAERHAATCASADLHARAAGAPASPAGAGCCAVAEKLRSRADRDARAAEPRPRLRLRREDRHREIEAEADGESAGGAGLAPRGEPRGGATIEATREDGCERERLETDETEEVTGVLGGHAPALRLPAAAGAGREARRRLHLGRPGSALRASHR